MVQRWSGRGPSLSERMSQIEGERSYPSKVLLFGEYSIICNSMALAIPYPLFDGKLEFGRGREDIGVTENNSQRELKQLARYLQTLQEKGEIALPFDLTSFFFDLQHGLYFSSSIPHGYGVGSSGAICAAVLGRYGEKWEERSNDLLFLRTLFGKMESFFHGKSSGIDPLVSFLNRPLLIVSEWDLKTVALPQFSGEKGAFFLLSTGRPHKTGPLVQLFLERLSHAPFYDMCQGELIPTTHDCIESFLDGNLSSLYEHFKKLSAFQYEHFSPMIPDEFKGVWKQGLEKNDYLLKLCGAGGGGFLLGMTPDIEKTKELLHEQQLRVLCSY